MRFQAIRVFAAIFTLAYCCASPLAPAAFAQTAETGTIAGTVTDASGAAVPGAAVVITDTDTGAVRALVTNADGSYTAPFLQSGHYKVVLGGGTFGKIDRENIVLTVGATLNISAALKLASVSSEVVVTSEEPLLDTQRVEVSQTVTQEFVSNLPVNGRRWDNFVLLTPNVAPDGNSGLISYRGISGLYNTNLVDGVSNQQALMSEARGRASGAPYVFSQDSIKEFQSSVSGYSAEFGGAAGGQVNAITKSGSNTIHADLFYYIRYPDLNALDPYNKWSALHNGGNPTLLTQTVHQQQQFGGSVGGPILKDKLFYFFTYDGFRKVNPILYTTSTPLGSATTAGTLLYFANTPSTPSNPTSLTPGTCPGPLTAAQCTAAANFLASQEGAFPRNVKQDIFFPKLDYQLNGKNHINTSFLWQDFIQPNGYSTAITTSNGGIGNNGTANFHERFFVAGWETVLNSRTANELHFQWSRDLETDTTNAPGPYASLASIASYGETSALPRGAEPDEHRWQIADVINQTRGRHSLKAGVDLNFIHEIMINLFQGDGNYGYSGTNTSAFTRWVADVYGVDGGQHYDSFTQVVDPITHAGEDNFWNKNLSAFLEDTYKVLPTLTLTAGLRYDVQLVPQPSRPYTTSANGVASPLGASVTTVINTNYKMFQPRIGFAWNPIPTTVVRGGYGIFYGLVPLSAYYNVRVENGVFQQQYNFSPNVTGSYAAYPTGAPSNLNVLFTPPGPPLAAPFTGASTPTPIGVPAGQALSPHGMAPNFTEPYTHSADLSVEQQLGHSTTITLGWVGTRGMRLPYSIDLNQPAYTGATRTYDVVSATGGVTQKTVTVPFYPAVAAALRPSPNDGNLSVAYSGLNTWYNAMAISVKQQMFHGLTGLLNYTWAHTEDAGQVSGTNGTFFGTDVILDPFNRKEIYSNPAINMSREQSRSDIDMRGRFVGSIVYTTTFHIANHYLAYAANSWTIGGTATEQTGFPITAMMSNNPGGAYTLGNVVQYPGTAVYTTGSGTTAVASGQDGGATGGADNTNNAPSSAYGRAPNVGRNAFPGPGIHNLDARISRDFPFLEHYRFQILMEAFNVVNHRNGLAVATTAYSFVAPGAASTCPATGGAAHANTCIVPYASSTPFGTINSTSSTLYGPRQLQFAAKLFF